MRGGLPSAITIGLFAGLFGAGCASRECAGSAERFCPCSPGLVGTQTCNREGAFEACECRLPDGGLPEREGGVPPRRCGDSFCDFDESDLTCPIDCGPDCGDGVCTFAESALSCPEDCPTTCGDGVCTGSETVVTCGDDCPVICGDGRCDPPETSSTCGDCGASCAPALLWATPLSEPGHATGAPGIAVQGGVTWVAWHDVGGDPPASTIQLYQYDGIEEHRSVIGRDIALPASVAVASSPMHGTVLFAWNDEAAGVVSIRMFDLSGMVGMDDIPASVIGDVAAAPSAEGFHLGWSEADAVIVQPLGPRGERQPSQTVVAAPTAGPALIEAPGEVRRIVVAWVDGPEGELGPGARAATVDLGGTRATEVFLPEALPGARPAIANNGSEVIVYVESADAISGVAIQEGPSFRHYFSEVTPGAVRLGQPAVWLDPRIGGALVYTAAFSDGPTLDLVIRELEYSGIALREASVQLTTTPEDDTRPALGIEPGSGLLSIAYNDVVAGVTGVSLLGVDLCR